MDRCFLCGIIGPKSLDINYDAQVPGSGVQVHTGIHSARLRSIFKSSDHEYYAFELSLLIKLRISAVHCVPVSEMDFLLWQAFKWKSKNPTV